MGGAKGWVRGYVGTWVCAYPKSSWRQRGLASPQAFSFRPEEHTFVPQRRNLNGCRFCYFFQRFPPNAERGGTYRGRDAVKRAVFWRAMLEGARALINRWVSLLRVTVFRAGRRGRPSTLYVCTAGRRWRENIRFSNAPVFSFVQSFFHCAREHRNKRTNFTR